MSKKVYFIPILLFLILAGFLAYALQRNSQGQSPNFIPSVMIGRPMPSFDLPPLVGNKHGLTSEDVKGKVALIDIFASWCAQCQVEHPLLNKIKKAGIVLIGINYKDKPEDARAWLVKLGNPYDLIGADREGSTAIDFGVYGAPESYLVDRHGIIRFKQTGPLTDEVIQDKILPLAKEID